MPKQPKQGYRHGGPHGGPFAHPPPQPGPYPPFPPQPAYASVLGPPPEGMAFPPPPGFPPHPHPFPPPHFAPPFRPVTLPSLPTTEPLEGHCAFCEDILFACQLVTFGECGHRACNACFLDKTFQIRREPLVCPCGVRVQSISGQKNKQGLPSGKRRPKTLTHNFHAQFKDQEVYEKKDDEDKEQQAASAAEGENQDKPKKTRPRLTEQERKERDKREALENNTSRVPKIVRGWMLEDRVARIEGAVLVLYHQEKDKDKISARCVRLFNDGYMSKASHENLVKVMVMLSGPNQKNMDEALDARFVTAEEKAEKRKKRKTPDDA